MLILLLRRRTALLESVLRIAYVFGSCLRLSSSCSSIIPPAAHTLVTQRGVAFGDAGQSQREGGSESSVYVFRFTPLNQGTSWARLASKPRVREHDQVPSVKLQRETS